MHEGRTETDRKDRYRSLGTGSDSGGIGTRGAFSASEYNGRVRFHDSAYYFKKQLFATALGLLVMYLASRVDYRLAVKLAPAAYIFHFFCLPQSCFLDRRSMDRRGG